MPKKIHPLPPIPDPIVSTIVKDGRSYRLEIPAVHADKAIRTMPGLCGRMLHGATIRLRRAC